MAGLTHRQAECLSYIEALTKDGVPPTFEELRVKLDVASKGNVHRLIQGLVRRGYVTHIPRLGRSLEVIRRPV